MRPSRAGASPSRASTLKRPWLSRSQAAIVRPWALTATCGKRTPVGEIVAAEAGVADSATAARATPKTDVKGRMQQECSHAPGAAPAGRMSYAARWR